MSIEALQTKLREVADARDWNPFHEPKTLILALVGEVGELAELFQWLTPNQANVLMLEPERAMRVREEMADPKAPWSTSLTRSLIRSG